jgi:hypothetical protein
MRHIEIHVIETETDAHSAVSCGLLTDAQLVAACADCGDDVGALNTFEPFCLVLDDEDIWYLCTYCAEPVTDPEDDRSYISLTDIASEDDEDDDFVVVDD